MTKKINYKQYEKIMQKFPDSIRFSTSNTANNVAFKGLKLADKQIKKQMTIRNKYTLGAKTGRGALQYTKSKPHHNMSKIVSSWGSLAKKGNRDYSYLERQEVGFTSESSTPVLAARIGKSKKKVSRKGARRKKIQKINATSVTDTIIQIHNAYKKGNFMPGSSQLFHLKENQYFNYGEGLYQFTAKTPPKRKTKTGMRKRFPNFRRLYFYGEGAEKKRRAQMWMKRSKAKISQDDIDKFFLANMDKAMPNK